MVEQFKIAVSRLSTAGETSHYGNRGYVFASYRNPEKPMDRHLFDRWLCEAEKLAGLRKLKGGLWHPYRRKWATERKHLPSADVMKAGGWLDYDTLRGSYEQTDAATLGLVVNEPFKLRAPASRSAVAT